MGCNHPEAHRMRFINSIGDKTVLCGVCAKNISSLDEAENMNTENLYDPTDPTQLSNYWREGGGDDEGLDFEDI